MPEPKPLWKDTLTEAGGKALAAAPLSRARFIVSFTQGNESKINAAKIMCAMSDRIEALEDFYHAVQRRIFQGTTDPALEQFVRDLLTKKASEL